MLDQLPPDQRAVLQLVLRQGKTYDELAGMLGIGPDSVRDRAVSALEAVGPDVGLRLTPEQRADVTDFLLGQQPLSQREVTRQLLAESAPARAWARGVAGELRPLARDELPELPEEGEAPAPPPEVAAPVAAAEDAEEPDDWRRERRAPTTERRSSRVGGAILLGLGGVAIAVAVVLLVSGGSSKHKSNDTVGTLSSSTPSTTSTSRKTPKPVAQVNLLPAQPGSKSVGLAQVFRQGSKRALIVAGQGLAPGAYAMWLDDPGKGSKLLGFVPQRVGKSGRFVTQGVLPANAGSYRDMIVSREVLAGSHPKPPQSPSTVVLRGRLRVG